MTRRVTKWHSGTRDVKFRAALDGDIVIIEGKLGKHRCCDTYSFRLADYPTHPYDRKQFLDRLYDTFGRAPDLVGQASRHTDAMMRLLADLPAAKESV